jgi:hypothetical protein
MLLPLPDHKIAESNLILEGLNHTRTFTTPDPRAEFHLAQYFWPRVTIYPIPDLALTLTTTLALKSKAFHPIAALVMAILGIGVWTTSACVNAFLVARHDISFSKAEA